MSDITAERALKLADWEDQEGRRYPPGSGMRLSYEAARDALRLLAAFLAPPDDDAVREALERWQEFVRHCTEDRLWDTQIVAECGLDAGLTILAALRAERARVEELGLVVSRYTAAHAMKAGQCDDQRARIAELEAQAAEWEKCFASDSAFLGDGLSPVEEIKFCHAKIAELEALEVDFANLLLVIFDGPRQDDAPASKVAAEWAEDEVKALRIDRDEAIAELKRPLVVTCEECEELMRWDVGVMSNKFGPRARCEECGRKVYIEHGNIGRPPVVMCSCMQQGVEMRMVSNEALKTTSLTYPGVPSHFYVCPQCAATVYIERAEPAAENKEQEGGTGG